MVLVLRWKMGNLPGRFHLYTGRTSCTTLRAAESLDLDDISGPVMFRNW